MVYTRLPGPVLDPPLASGNLYRVERTERNAPGAPNEDIVQNH